MLSIAQLSFIGGQAPREADICSARVLRQIVFGRCPSRGAIACFIRGFHQSPGRLLGQGSVGLFAEIGRKPLRGLAIGAALIELY